jgi:hypothetical protein
MRGHINQAHKLLFQACTYSFESVQLQSWFRGGWAKYWIVRVEATATAIANANPSNSEPNELHRLEQQEIQRLQQLEQDYIAQEAELEDSDNSHVESRN